MPPLRHWLARLCASGPRASAPSRKLRTPRLLSLENLEDRLVPTGVPTVLPTVTNTTSWRSETFSIDDTVVNSGSTAASTAAAGSSPQNASFGAQIGLNQLLETDDAYAGKGYTVAVIDTGIDYNNPDLGGGWGKRVIGGYDFYNNDSDPMDDNGHGTDVAGIIGASDATYSGVAPDVNFVALKVLGADGSGTFGMVSEALDWVVANRTKYNIVAVNMSLGSGNYTIDPYTFLEGDLQTLAADNVFIGVASGNDYYTYQAQGLAFPAISPNVVSVGAVWDGNYGSVGWANGARDNTTAVDQITSFTQRGPNLDILAPGAMVTSLYLGDTFKAMAGTSMATPVIVGSAVVLREELDALRHSSLDNQSSILQIMQSTGVTVVDNNAAAVNVPVTGETFKRINLLAAVDYVEGLSGGTGNTGGGGTTTSGPSLAAIGTQNLGLGGTVNIGLNATDSNLNAALTLTADVVGYNASSALAYTLKQSLGLTYSGSYFTNTWGKNEKWLEGSGGTYYAILPDGEFRKWTGSLDAMMSSADLIATLDPADYNDPSLLWNAQPAAAAPLTLTITGNHLTVAAGQTAGTYTVDVTASDGTQSTDQKFTVVVIGAANGTVDHGPVWTTIADQTMHSGTLNVPLTATDPDGDALTFSSSVSGATGVGLVISGKNLAISPPTGYSGTFTVTVTASDGQISSSTTFHVTVAGNSPPTVSVPATVAATAGSNTASFAIVASDPNGDALTTTATVQSATTASSTLYQLKQSLGLTYAGGYFQNIRGLNEKWLISANRTTWYCILPNGELCKYANTNAQMLSPGNVIAKLDPSVYANPSLLWNAAPPVAAAATVKISNGLATVTVAQGYHGTMTVLVTVSDGTTTVTKTVTVTF
jgi:subtilisin family serine protease